VKILVLGASGFVGASLAGVLSARGHDVTGASRSGSEPLPGLRAIRLDLTHAEDALAAVAREAPDVVVHLVAEPDVKKAESPEQRAAAAAIVGTTARVAEACARDGRVLVLLSSDYVFDGRSGPYSEDDKPNPLGEYGRVKVATEEAVARTGSWLIVRTSMVYGWPRPGQHPNFVSRLVESARAGESTHAFRDVVRTPIYVGHVSSLMADLIDAGATGIFHAGSTNAVSMLELSVQACGAFGLPAESVIPGEAGDTDPTRPRLCGLDVAKASAVLGRPLASTDEGLSLMKEEEHAYA
jgi:dTDP-4-dehydrorhamnose reductase